jgi:predicted small integral membrane protein
VYCLRGMWQKWVPAGMAFAASIFLLVAGVVVWREMSPPPMCPPNAFCAFHLFSPRRLHPLRAELLWAASAAFAVVGACVTVRVARRPRFFGTAT